MFRGYEFVFAGESSRMYGLMLCSFGNKKQGDVSFGNVGEIRETTTAGRIRPIYHGVDYHKKPLEFKLVFGAERRLDRYEMENISLWLTGQQEYQWLSICQPDMEHVQFRCLITELTPTSHNGAAMAFEANVRCDCPYAYGWPFEESYTISGETEVVLHNDGSAREYIRPELLFAPNDGITSLSIVNESDGCAAFTLTNIPASGVVVRIDNENGIIQYLSNEDKTVGVGGNPYDGFGMHFLQLVRGDNILIVNGDGMLTVSGRFLHNVAG